MNLFFSEGVNVPFLPKSQMASDFLTAGICKVSVARFHTKAQKVGKALFLHVQPAAKPCFLTFAKPSVK
jgi:hypothetical protein